MNKTLSKLTFALLVFSPFTTWLALNDYIRFNIFILICILLINAIYYNRTKQLTLQKNTNNERILMFAFIIMISISFGINLITNFQSKIISNYIATLFIIGLLYYYYSSVIQNYITCNNIIKALAYSGLLLLIIITTDSILVNFFDIEIRKLFIWGYQGNAAYFRRTAWISPSSPTEEPGVSALYLNVLIPFTLYYFRKKRITITLLFVFCTFSLFSSVGLFIALSGGIIILYLKSKLRTTIIISCLIIFLITILIGLLANNEYVQLVIGQWSFIDKITLAGNSTSSSERSEGFAQAISDGLDSPLYGKGPGYGKAIIGVGYLSTFLSFLGNYGFIAFFIFCSIWIIYIWKCFHINKKYRYLFIYSFYSLSIAAIIGDNLHNFALWMLLPIISKFYNEYNIKHEKNITHS